MTAAFEENCTHQLMNCEIESKGDLTQPNLTEHNVKPSEIKENESNFAFNFGDFWSKNDSDD